MQQWRILDTGTADAEKNMAIDRELLQQLTIESQPILHLYDWKGPSATYGYFVNPFNYFDPAGVKRHRLRLAKRPTGGGIVFHLWDVAFSVLIPSQHPQFSFNTLDNYAFINRAVSEAIRAWRGVEPQLLYRSSEACNEPCSQFCMAMPVQYDVMIDSRKVGGGAQRRTRHGFLHQGTISLLEPDISLLRELFLPGISVVDAIAANSYALMDRPDPSAKRDLLHCLAKCFK